MDRARKQDIRNRIIGVLVERARRRNGRSQEACAHLLGCSLADFQRYETGEAGLSLPQLEALAHILDVPANHLWDDEAVLARQPASSQLPMTELILRRNRAVADAFRRCRKSGGLSEAEMGERLGQPAEIIAQYESAERPIPLAELEVAARGCGLTLSAFVDRLKSPSDPKDRDRRSLARLSALSPHLSEFFLAPENTRFLELAHSLSAVEHDALRQLARALLRATDAP